MSKKKNSKNKKKKVIIVIALAIIILVIGILSYFIFFNKSKSSISKKNSENEVVQNKLKIVDLSSNSRNYAVMVNNIKAVWGKQAGLQDAYIVYEITVEGGITRFLAIFRDQTTEKIGSVRSARPYYLDYVLENDAIYNHVGGSPTAMSELNSMGIDHIEAYTRDKSVSKVTEYTAFTSIKLMEEKAKKRKYRLTSDKDLLFNYSVDEIDLSQMEGATKADTVYLQYNSGSRSFEYDEENKIYKRYQGDNPHIDYVTKKQYTAKNIITYQIQNSTISGDKKGRQSLDNIGSGNGYYITDGYAVPITWEKKSRNSQTVYRYLNGEEITLNDGNTFIQIQPKNKELSLKAIELTTE